MKVNFNSIEGSFNFEQREDCKITRTIYYWNSGGFPENYSLLRIYEFANKTVVIASQLRGVVRWDEIFIRGIVKNFTINQKNLIWINHQGIFSDYKPPHDIFARTLLKWNFNKLELEKEEEINSKQVEEIIGFDLEPVETWLGLDPKLQQEIYIKQQKKLIILSKFT